MFFSDGGESCECREACDIYPNEEDNLLYEECIEDCIEDHSDDPLGEEYCLEACDYLLKANELQCLRECGTPDPIRRMNGYAFAYRLWRTHSIHESQMGAPDEFFESDFLLDDINIIVHNSSQDFQNMSISYCYQYVVLVSYDDGTCCRFFGSGCVQNG